MTNVTVVKLTLPARVATRLRRRTGERAIAKAVERVVNDAAADADAGKPVCLMPRRSPLPKGHVFDKDTSFREASATFESDEEVADFFDEILKARHAS